MNSDHFEPVIFEITNALNGRRFMRCLQTSDTEFLFDLKLPDSRFLLVNLTPSDPRIYLTQRRPRDIERAAKHPSGFVQYINNRLLFADVAHTEFAAWDRSGVIDIDLSVTDRVVNEERFRIIIQLSGGISNIFLLDENKTILAAARNKDIAGQRTGDIYSVDENIDPHTFGNHSPITDQSGGGQYPVSDILDSKYAEQAEKAEFESLSRTAIKKTTQELRKKEKLARNLESDKTGHGDAGEWKKFGDLLLANAHNARREAEFFVVTDYFDPDLAEVRIEADRNDSPTSAAEKYFRKYTRSRNAAEQIADRMKEAERGIKKAAAALAAAEQAVADKNVEFLRDIVGVKKAAASIRAAKKISDDGRSVRTFISTDGFEILVGKKAKDNDHLTFRMARSLDTWMHAADYPGSHVVIRNPNRKEIPHLTLIEAGEIAAFYSQGRSQPKAAVNYTLKKFVNKPKGALPGLVSLASFKTLLVEPKVGLQMKDVIH